MDAWLHRASKRDKRALRVMNESVDAQRLEINSIQLENNYSEVFGPNGMVLDRIPYSFLKESTMKFLQRNEAKRRRRYNRTLTMVFQEHITVGSMSELRERRVTGAKNSVLPRAAERKRGIPGQAWDYSHE